MNKPIQTCLDKMYRSLYRVRCDGMQFFGQINKSDGQWNADICRSDTAEVVRFAGIWRTLRDARDECDRVLAREFASRT